MRQIFRRFRRRPAPAIGVLVFALILSAVLCGLQMSNEAEVEKYWDTFYTIPVEMAVTNLTGSRSENLQIPAEIANVFLPYGELAKYVTDVQMEAYLVPDGDYHDNLFYGISSMDRISSLQPENAEITWVEGYDEGIFAGDEMVCLAPESLILAMQITSQEPVSETEEILIHGCMAVCLDPEVKDSASEEDEAIYLEITFVNGQEKPAIRYTCKVKVVGTYTGSSKAVYSPFETCRFIYRMLNKRLEVQAIYAKLENNDYLEELREVSQQWFLEPDPLGSQVPWGMFGFTYYRYALDINDGLLQRMSETLQNSIITNRVCAVLVLCLSAGAGLLIGFLMVRSRKREITLMRTMGTPGHAIYFSFAAEQMICFVLGITLGGAYNQWNPKWQLGLLIGVFFVGLTIALLVFLRKNLMTIIKEEE